LNVFGLAWRERAALQIKRGGCTGASHCRRLSSAPCRQTRRCARGERCASARRDYGDAVDRGLPFQLRALEGALAAAAAGLTEEAAALEARALPAADRLARRVRRPARPCSP